MHIFYSRFAFEYETEENQKCSGNVIHVCIFTVNRNVFTAFPLGNKCLDFL